MSDFIDLKIRNFCLSINESSLSIVKIKTGRNSFSLLSFGREKLEKGIIKGGIVEKEEALVAAIDQACKKVKGEKLKTKFVTVSLPEEESFLQVIQMPKMTEDELKMAVTIEAENYIPMPIEQAYFDFQVIKPMEDGLDHLDVLIVAMSQKIVDSYISCVKRAGLIPIAVEIEPQAIARALVKVETIDSPIILVDISANKLEFVIFSGNSIRFTSSAPFLSAEMDTEKLISHIQKYIDFYKEHASHEHIVGESIVRKIMLCGGVPNLKDLAGFISQKIGIETVVGDTFVNYPKKNRNRTRLKDPSQYAAVLGLALRSLNQ